MGLHVAALGTAIVLTAFSQVLLRSGARRGASVRASFLNLRTAVGYGLFLVVTLLMVFALQAIPLKTVTAWGTITYVLTLVLARAILGERITLRMVAGVALILLGIVVFSLGGVWA